MALNLPFLKREKSIEELEEETEKLEAENREKDQEVSLEEKRYTIAQLKARGLKINQFSGQSLDEKIKRAIKWIKAH